MNPIRLIAIAIAPKMTNAFITVDGRSAAAHLRLAIIWSSQRNLLGRFFTIMAFVIRTIAHDSQLFEVFARLRPQLFGKSYLPFLVLVSSQREKGIGAQLQRF